MRRLLPLAVLFLTLATGCARTLPMARAPEPVAALPAIPELDGDPMIRVLYPAEGQNIGAVDSNFIFGTTGTGRARLVINGVQVPVAPNGAFLAFLPVPEDGQYRLEARRRGARTESLLTVKRPAPAAAAAAPANPAPSTSVQANPAPPRITGVTAVPSMLKRGVVTGGRDTLATGSDVVYGAPSPTADRRWFFPKGARVNIAGTSGGNYRVQLAGDVVAYVDTSGITIDTAAVAPPGAIGRPEIVQQGRYTDLRLPVAFAPYLLIPSRNELLVTVYGRTAPTEAPNAGGGVVGSATVTAATQDSVQFRFGLTNALWGYKAFYAPDGALVLRLRSGPQGSGSDLLRGMRIVVDPGHPPAGAVGPTGLTEAEANLAVGLRLAEQLRSRGAEVLMTRTSGATLASATNAATELWARVDFAVNNDADLLVSVHNNAFPDGVNPFENYGSEAYYYHPFARDLAGAMVAQIVPVTGLPNLGAKARSLALARPTWMPSVLTESLFMMFPQQEAALRDPAFQDRLAAAHVRAIEQFVREYLGH